MAGNKDPEIEALRTILSALKEVDPPARRKVIASVLALLDETPAAGASQQTIQHAPIEPRGPGVVAQAVRPLSVIELLQQKKPSSNTQRIALFAYYRERYENRPRFSRADLQAYFAKAKLPPAGNYDRDFVEAVRKGWVHEDDADSYLTTKGIEAIESGFQGEAATGRKPSPRTRSASSKRRARR